MTQVYSLYPSSQRKSLIFSVTTIRYRVTLTCVPIMLHQWIFIDDLGSNGVLIADRRGEIISIDVLCRDYIIRINHSLLWRIDIIPDIGTE